MLLPFQGIELCKIYGQDPNDFAQLAIREYIEQKVKEWANIETYALVMDLRAREEWMDAAYDVDDCNEWIKELKKRGFTETRTGIPLNHRKIARKRIDPLIRAARREA